MTARTTAFLRSAALLSLVWSAGLTAGRAEETSSAREGGRTFLVAEKSKATGGAKAAGKAKGAAKAADASPPAGTRVQRDIQFARRDSGPLTLDLYLPANITTIPAAERPSLPIIVWVHGGGWNAGSKDKCPGAYLAAQGYAVASIDYRLTTVAPWPAQIDDCHDAVRWLRSNAAIYGMDANHIVAWGGSAGGHLVALMGTMDAPAGEAVSSRVQGVIDWFGPTDLLTMPPNVLGPGKTEESLAKSNGAQLLGGKVKDLPEKAKAASALYQVSKDDPPFLIMHGDQDTSVPLDQSERLAAKLKDVGVPVEMKVVAGAGHGTKEFYTDASKAIVEAFLARVTKK